jgi:MGT family glycosyltransferase
MSLNFLFTSWGNPGNLNPLLTAARRLRQRGHRVRFLGEADHQEETVKAGFDALAWRRPVPMSPPSADDENLAKTEITELFDKVIFGGALDYASDTRDALRAEPVDAVVTNDILMGPVIAAEAAGIPCALLAPHISIRPLDGVPVALSGLAPNDRPHYHEEEQAARQRIGGMLENYLPVLNRARAAFGLVPLRNVYDHYDRADRLLIGIAAGFDFPATNLPANLRYVGPLLDMPAWTAPWTAPWSGTAGRPRVLVSLSTSFQNQGPLLRRIIAALGTLDLDAVVTVGPAMEKEQWEVPPNVTIRHSAPHDTVMKEVSLVITHGGHGTVTRSLVNGAPLLVLPMGRDQADNAARVVARGAGLSLKQEASEAEIAAAVQRLVTEPNFRVAALQLGKAIAPDVNSPVFANEMEALAARRWSRSA